MSYDSKHNKELKDRVKKYRDLILLLEIGAFIHDLGKLSSFFIVSKAKGASTKDFHGQILFIDLIAGNKIPSPIISFLFTPIYRLLGLPRTVSGIDLSISLSHFVCAHHGCSRCLYKLARGKLGGSFPTKAEDCSFKDTIDDHPFIALLKTVDHLDASNPADSGKQGILHVKMDQFFYGEKEVPLEKLNSYRTSFYRDLSNFLSEHFLLASLSKTQNPLNFVFTHQGIVNLNKFVKSLGEKYFSHALSETRKYGNDITLLDHAKSVSSCFKIYLFDHLVRGKPLINSFFDAHFRILSIPNAFKECEEKLSYEFAFSNLIFRSDENLHFLVPDIRKNVIRNLLHTGAWHGCAVEESFSLSRGGDFSVIFNDTLEGEPLQGKFAKLKAMKIKSPEGLGFTEEELRSELKRVVFFSMLKKKEALQRKLKSSLKHLENLKNGAIYDEKNLFKYYRKENEINRIRRHLESKPTIETIKYRTGWKSSKDAEKEVYDFFNTILSPIRPPSPIEMSNFFLKEYHRLGSFKGLYENLIIRRPLTPGRIYAFTRNLVKFIYEENKK